jgi:hypothetical protein
MFSALVSNLGMSQRNGNVAAMVPPSCAATNGGTVKVRSFCSGVPEAANTARPAIVGVCARRRVQSSSTLKTGRDEFTLWGGGEGVASGWATGAKTLFEPVGALSGSAVSEFVGHYTAGFHFLQVVVADGGSGVDGRINVALFQKIALLRGVGPDSGIAIGLEFNAYGDGIGHFGILLHFLANFLLGADDFLHMMADLVSDYVGLREFAGSAELIFQFVEKAQVEVNLLVAGTIKGAGGGLREAAGGIDAAAV